MSSSNEWSTLRHVVLGDAKNLNWPIGDPVFNQHLRETIWHGDSLRLGPIDRDILALTSLELDYFQKTLESLGVKVSRPIYRDHYHYNEFGSYCPRDNIVVLGDKNIVAPMTYPSRRSEWRAYESYLTGEIIVCSDPDAKFDAANICRLGDTVLYLQSKTGNRAGFEWLEREFGEQYQIVLLDNIYNGVHIDSTVVPLREGLVMLNAGRVNFTNVPSVFKDWDIIWIDEDDVTETEYRQYPYASKWIGMNVLSVSPDVVIYDPRHPRIAEKIQKYGINTVPVQLTHSRTLGGGHHCVTLDVRRAD